MQKIPKQEFTAAFKEQAVKRVKDGKRVSAVAKEMGLVEQTLRHWVKAFDAGTLNGAGIRKVTPEAMDLSRLRAENARLKREVEILQNRPRGFSCARWIETGSRLHSWSARTLAACFLEALTPSKNLAQGKLRTQLWWHIA
ncbi:transposase [Thiocystis violascens DSM 198]|uniref:Transposase n=1 Tax=Thiocystis violascens (strain ATCC 17096 / DSM 198 / 6111) TaxID=765911 RepID=I3YC57_THIV6|nr:transposase [Thiocystis violascens DSM 198]AFL74575.1 transposase [Thiocystis violascens DSM 198]